MKPIKILNKLNESNEYYRPTERDQERFEEKLIHEIKERWGFKCEKVYSYRKRIVNVYNKKSGELTLPDNFINVMNKLSKSSISKDYDITVGINVGVDVDSFTIHNPIYNLDIDNEKIEYETAYYDDKEIPHIFMNVCTEFAKVSEKDIKKVVEYDEYGYPDWSQGNMHIYSYGSTVKVRIDVDTAKISNKEFNNYIDSVVKCREMEVKYETNTNN